MKQSIAFSLLLASLFLFSCNNKTEAPAQENSVSGTPSAGNDALKTAPSLSPTTPTSAAPVANPAVTMPVTTPTTGTVAAGMNPPHGQPNHRCDIAVGAPLNSPPGKAPANKPPTNTQQIAMPAQPATTVTAPGMNPPHGQPGHRCDIAVGTSLSQPIKTLPNANPAGTLPTPAPANTTTTEPPK